jgi:hypothetical protein
LTVKASAENREKKRPEKPVKMAGVAGGVARRHLLEPAPAVACTADMKKPERILRLGR